MNTIIPVVLSELFVSYFLGRLLRLLKQWSISPREEIERDPEIITLEKEVQELNKPSTFTEYVKKARKLNTLKQEEEEKIKKANLESGRETYFHKFITYFLNFLYLILWVIQILPPIIRQFIFLVIFSILIGDQSLPQAAIKKLYSPFLKNEISTQMNMILEFGITCTMTELIKGTLEILFKQQ
ncbi:hypothetical protein HWI79_576 [Cryptosporidium felis]|nr:hypothetical protein HWI79_576 [Cryptosporidium felis]